MVTKGWRASRSQVVASSSVVVISSMPGLSSGGKTGAPRFMTGLYASHRRHVKKRPGRGEGADRNFDEGGAVAAGQGAPQRSTEHLGAAGPIARGAEAFGEFYEIRIGEVAGDKPVAELFLLDAAD